MVEPEQTSIAEQRLGSHVPATMNSNERVIARQQVAKYKIPVIRKRGTVQDVSAATDNRE
jgi:hypothetical protein